MPLDVNGVSHTFDSSLTDDNNTETHMMEIEMPDLNLSDGSSQTEPEFSEADRQTLKDSEILCYHILAMIGETKKDGGTVLPWPKTKILTVLHDFFYGKPVKKMKLTSEELHEYLKLNIVDKAPERMPKLDTLNIKTSLREMIPDLIKGFRCLRGINKKLISRSMDYGAWLNVAFDKFDLQKKRGLMKVTWSKWLKKYVGISDSHARHLREIAILFGEYKKIRNLGITFKELFQLKKEILNMLHENEEWSEFWCDTTL